MTKRVEITERIAALLKAKLDDESADLSKVVVFECVAASTRKITQRGSAYDKAVMAKSVLDGAVAHLAEESVPILVMHEGRMLPVGQTLEAQVIPAADDHHELRCLFYMDANSTYVDQIELGIVDEVSVGMLANHAYCSECDFDYMAEGNEFHFWLRECDKEHQLGAEGVHLRLSGCDTWKELSLVNKGASSKPKIVGRSKQVLSADQFQQLAASGANPDIMYLLCSSTQPEGKPSKHKPSKETPMELSQAIDKYAEEKAAKLALEANLADVNGKLETSDNALNAANTQIAELTSKVEALEAADTAVELASAKELNVELSGFIKKNWELALKATGQEIPEEAPSAKDMISQLDAAQAKLASIPRGGVAAPVEGEEAEAALAQTMAHATAFQSK